MDKLAAKACVALVLGSIAVSWRAAPPPPATMAAPASPPAGGSALMGLPLHFEELEGPRGSPARYVARSHGVTLALTAEGAIARSGGHDLRISLPGSTPQPVLRGEQPLPGRVNYFIGDDRAAWRTGVPTYGAVRYHDVYPGVDLVWHGKQDRLEYDFVVAPGVDASRIRVAIAGAIAASLEDTGDLVLVTGNGDWVQRKPVAYQDIGGRRIDVAARYEVRRDSSEGPVEVAFALGDYDATRELVIDPVLLYATFLGGSGSDSIAGLQVDGAGAVYVAGTTSSADLPAGGHPPTSFGSGPGGGVFVAKLAPGGDRLEYLTYLSSGEAEDLAVDGAGNVYVAGNAFGSGFPTTPGAYDRTSDDADGFVAKLSADGSQLLYATVIGDDYTMNRVSSVAIDAEGNAHIAGHVYQYDPLWAPAGDPARPLGESPAGARNPHDTQDAYVAKLNAEGSELVYMTLLGGTSYDWATDIAVDGAGFAYVTGQTDSGNCTGDTWIWIHGNYWVYIPTQCYWLGPASDMPVTPGAFDMTHAGNYLSPLHGTDGFLAKLHPLTGHLVYSTYLDAAGIYAPQAVAVDAAGYAYVSGTDRVAKLSPAGDRLEYEADLPMVYSGHVRALVVDTAGSAYVAGINGYIVNHEHGSDAKEEGWVGKLDGAGALVFETRLRGAVLTAVAAGSAGHIYVAGNAYSSDLGTTSRAIDREFAGVSEGFIARIGPGPEPFDFDDVTGAATGTEYASNPITLSGTDAGVEFEVTIAGGRYSKNGAAYTDTPGQAAIGDTLRVTLTSSADASTTTSATLTIGGVEGVFSVTTGATDTTPAPFAFVDQTGVDPGTVRTSSAITVAGINAAVPITVTGGKYRINSGAYTTTSGEVRAGDTVRVQHAASWYPYTTVNTILTIGGVSDTFSSTTNAKDVNPDPFGFPTVYGAPRNTLIESTVLTPAGFDAPARILISSGSAYRINGGAWTSATGSISPGNTLQVRHTTAPTASTWRGTIVRIGEVTGYFRSQTAP